MSQLARMQNFSLRRGVPFVRRGGGGENKHLPREIGQNWRYRSFHIHIAYPKHNSMLITNMLLVFANFVGKIWIRAIFEKVILCDFAVWEGIFRILCKGKSLSGADCRADHDGKIGFRECLTKIW